MAFQSLCIGCLVGWGSQDELQKLSTKCPAQMQPRSTFIATCCFPLLLKGIWDALWYSASVLAWGFPGCFCVQGNISVCYFVLVCCSLWPGWHAHPCFVPLAARLNQKAGATAGSSHSSHVFYPQRAAEKRPSCSWAGTWPAVQSHWISNPSCQAALVLVQTHVITCNMDTIPSFLRAPGPSRRKRRQKIKHGRNRRQRSCCCRLCLEQKNEHKGRDRAGG